MHKLNQVLKSVNADVPNTSEKISDAIKAVSDQAAQERASTQGAAALAELAPFENNGLLDGLPARLAAFDAAEARAGGAGPSG